MTRMRPGATWPEPSTEPASHPAMGMHQTFAQVVATITCGYLDERPKLLERMATQTRHLRAEDLPSIPVPDGIAGYELVSGELVPVMPSLERHSWLVFEVAKALDAQAHAVAAGSVFPDVWCKLPVPDDPERLYAPDISFFATEKVQAESGDGIFHSPPDLAVEIFSETNRRKPGDFQRRIRNYLEAGVRLLWVIHPDAGHAMIYRADGSARMVREAEALDGEDVLPGFRLELGPLFAAMPGAQPPA
ncbi:MAG: Uma2 family endonuclease [Gemmatimonadetes bacterium]|nr:Uma2 family endonuclease [Gemmatimonadota bacterium]